MPSLAGAGGTKTTAGKDAAKHKMSRQKLRPEENNVRMRTNFGEDDGWTGNREDQLALHHLAPKHARIRDEVVTKLDSSGYWAARRLIMTREALYVCSASFALPREGQFRIRRGRAWVDRFVSLEDGCISIFKDQAASRENHPPESNYVLQDCRVDTQANSAYGWLLTIDLSHQGIHLELACSDFRKRGEFVSAVIKHRELLKRERAEDLLDTIPCHDIVRTYPFEADFFEKPIESMPHNGPDGARIEGESNTIGINYFVPAGFAIHARKNYIHEDRIHALVLDTAPDGPSNGRTFCFQFDSAEHCDQWKGAIDSSSKAMKDVYNRRHFWTLLQLRFRRVMLSTPFQFVLTSLIFMSWAVTLVDAEIRPEAGEFLFWLFDRINFYFTIIFAVELGLNMLSYWFWPFFKDGWLIFDSCIVLLSIAGLIFKDAPSAKQMRVLRILRVLRAFGRLKNLRKIINGIMASILPLSQALIIAVLFLSIFCTLGTELFGNDAPGHFGSFSRSFYTLFTVILGRWPDDLLPSFREDGTAIIQNVLFFYSYMLVEVIVLLQVVVAVLLDNFFRAAQQSKEEEALAASERRQNAQSNLFPLDPVMEDLVTNFTTFEDFEMRVDRLFNSFDVDRGGAISREELSHGLQKFKRILSHDPDMEPSHPRLSPDDWNVLTEDATLCDEEGNLAYEEFRIIVFKKFRQFVQRKLSDAVRLLDNPLEVQANLLTQKYLMVTSIRELNGIVEDSKGDKEKNAGGADVQSPKMQPAAQAPPTEEHKDLLINGEAHADGEAPQHDSFSAGVMTGLQMVLTMLESQPSSRAAKFAPALRTLVESIAHELRPDQEPASLKMDLVPIRRGAPSISEAGMRVLCAEKSATSSEQSSAPQPFQSTAPEIETQAQPATSVIQMDFSRAEDESAPKSSRGDAGFEVNKAGGRRRSLAGDDSPPANADMAKSNSSKAVGALQKRQSVIDLGRQHLVSEPKYDARGIQGRRSTSISLPRTLDVQPHRPHTHRDIRDFVSESGRVSVTASIQPSPAPPQHEKLYADTAAGIVPLKSLPRLLATSQASQPDL